MIRQEYQPPGKREVTEDVNSWECEWIQEKKTIEYSSCNLSTQQPRACDTGPAGLTRNVRRT